jgi:hypothetical protein
MARYMGTAKHYACAVCRKNKNSKKRNFEMRCLGLLYFIPKQKNKGKISPSSDLSRRKKGM